MTLLFTILITLVCFLVFLNAYRLWDLRDAKRKAKLPDNKKPTMFDVRYLLMEGERELATKLYCEIFHTNTAKAKKDIQELERSLKVG